MVSPGARLAVLMNHGLLARLTVNCHAEVSTFNWFSAGLGTSKGDSHVMGQDPLLPGDRKVG